MAQDAVMAMVEKELKANPDIKSGELKEKVAKKHKAVAKLSVRQFHARYPLRVKKRWSLEKGGGKSGSKSKKASAAKKPARRTRRARRRTSVPAAPAATASPSAAPSGARDLLVQFAEELLQMKDPSFTSVIARVDHYAAQLGDS